MERGKLWRSAFEGDVRLLERNAAGLTEALAARRPAPGVASAAWILGHLVNTRRGILKLLDASRPEDPAWRQHYGRGTAGEGAHLSWSELMGAFQATDSALKEAFAAFQDWDRPTLNPALGVEQPLEEVLAFLFRHEGYHLGQIGLIRKLHGLSGAI